MFDHLSSVPRRAWMPAVAATLLLAPPALAQSGPPRPATDAAAPRTRADSLYVSADPGRCSQDE
jgi:hypothetical protein